MDLLDTEQWSQHSVLVVEDSAVQRAHLVSLVRKIGFGLVLEASNGNEAIQILEARNGSPVFLVVTDLEMPGMDGIELVRKVAAGGLASKMIAVSARDPRLLEIIESMGMADATMGLLGTAPKPVCEADLLRLLGRSDEEEVRNPAAKMASTTTHAELAKAVEQRQFVLHYQPKVAVKSGHMKGVEALARWQHPERGLLSPLHFIDQLEGTPLMIQFTLDIVEQALRQMLQWQVAGLPALSVSINLSAANLCDGAFVGRLVAMVKQYGIAPQSLTWEVTETIDMDDMAPALANLGHLRLLGFGLAMDDYGIGYSSMQKLSRCPFTELKIDRAFVDGAAQRQNRQVFLENAIDLGRRLGATTVAEGVEVEADFRMLSKLGCDMVQGYLVARPMAPQAVAGWFMTERLRLRKLAASS
jgi:EAL domain-containing protein (putative c-di-GMP-specific phosphodiesterase class I)